VDSQPTKAEVEEAIQELHDYLSDKLAPLMAADAVGLLIRYPSELLANHIHNWVGGQQLTSPLSDYLFHGARKVALMGEFNLVPRPSLAGYLISLGESLAAYCPEDDRELLKQNIERLARTEVSAVIAAPPNVLHKQEVPKAAPPSVAQKAVGRFALLLNRLRPLAAPDAPVEQRTQVASRFVSEAAVQARSVEDFNERLSPLKDVGIDTATDQLFKTLARSLPGWLLPQALAAKAAVPAPEQLDAMRKMVTLAPEPAEVGRRFREMVHAAVEQFNEGNLGRAASMFELAEKMISEQAVAPKFVDPLRTTGHEYLNAERLRRSAERVENRPHLRTVLRFFHQLRPEGLLKALDGEPKRDRRHQLLALLEVHEGDARAVVWEMLKSSIGPEAAEMDAFFQGNLVYLLRILQRPASASVEEEVDAAMRVCGRTSPAPVVKQVIAFLAATRHEKSERALMTYLKVFENMVLQPETAAYPPAEVETLLDRTCAALARYGSPRATRLLIDHGLKTEARLGATFMRLAEAGRLDLSSSRDLVERIVAAIRAELPKGGMLGFAQRSNDAKIHSLLMALAGTPLPEVRSLLEEVAARHKDKPYGETASKALGSLDAVGKPPAPAASMTGDLELFGLPNLLQMLSQSALTGLLNVMTADGKAQATLIFEHGLFRGGQNGIVLGEEALYQLLERPFPGTFAFVSRPDVSSHPRVSPPEDVLGLLMEGVRRHDEFTRAATLVADNARLKATGKPHTGVSDEDPDFATYIWGEVVKAKDVHACEASISSDSYRIRRLMAHWVEEGALAVA
jgi:hypothetical protein